MVGDNSDRSHVIALSHPPVHGELKDEYEELEAALAGNQHKTAKKPALPLPTKQGFSLSDTSAEYIEVHNTSALYEK